MAIKLTDIDIADLIGEAEHRGKPIYRATELDTQFRLPEHLGEARGCELKLRHGLLIEIRKGVFWQHLQHVRQHEPSFPLTSKFYLSGSSRVQTLDVSDINNDYEEIVGRHYLYHLPNQAEIEQWQSEQPIHVVMIYADPDYFRAFNFGEALLSTPLQKLLEGDRSQRFHQSLGQMTPFIRQLLQQILHCPYTGLMQQLYLESKALELFAAQFALWTDAPSPTAAPFLCAQDIEQLHQAKEILTQRAAHPPSLVELARQVGLNERKLKEGFRHLFGTTAFEYLRKYRLQQAKDLLQDPGLTIANVATTVGYRSPEAFSTAFRRKFAVSPKAYQLSQR
jgi:AraC-like DNA-binding protein